DLREDDHGRERNTHRRGDDPLAARDRAPGARRGGRAAHGAPQDQPDAGRGRARDARRSAQHARPLPGKGALAGMAAPASDALERARRVRLMLFDVDGVLTDGTLWYGPGGEALKGFNV